MLTIGYFLMAMGIFLIFSFLITLLGYIFQYYAFKQFKFKSISLTTFLESFGIGTALFIFYSYLIINFLRAFNLFSIYFPLIIFDSINLVYIIFKKNSKSKIVFKNLINKLRNALLNKQTKSHIYIIIIIITLLFLVQGVIETYLSLPSKDPYNWLTITLYLQKYGDLNYNNYTVHGVGFVVFTAGSLLITNDFYIQYFFIKYVPIFFFIIIILTIYNIASAYFKKKIEILIVLIVLLSFNTLLFRFSLAVPSIIATTLGIIFFNTLTQQENLKMLIIRAILLGGIFLTHPLYFLFLFVFIFIFDLLILFNDLKNNSKTKENKKSVIFSNFIKKYGVLLLISLLFTIPYFINLQISGKSLYKNFTRYLFRGYQADISNFFKESSRMLNINRIFLLSLKPSRTDFFFNFIYFGLNLPINKTLNWGVIFLIFGLFYNLKEENSMHKYLINFIKFSFILAFIIFILNSLLFVIDNELIVSLASFINQYGPRVIELFSPVWAFLFILGVKKIFELIKSYKIKKIQGYTVTKIEKIAKYDLIFDRRYIIALILLGAFVYSSHLYIQYTVYYENHYKDDDLTEALLFMGNYFNKEDLEDQTILLPENIDSTIFQLIYHKDFDREYIEYDNTNYTILMDEVENENVDFVLVYKVETKDSCLEQIDDEQKVLYENPHYLFFKVK